MDGLDSRNSYFLVAVLCYCVRGTLPRPGCDVNPLSPCYTWFKDQCRSYRLRSTSLSADFTHQSSGTKCSYMDVFNLIQDQANVLIEKPIPIPTSSYTKKKKGQDLQTNPVPVCGTRMLRELNAPICSPSFPAPLTSRSDKRGFKNIADNGFPMELYGGICLLLTANPCIDSCYIWF